MKNDNKGFTLVELIVSVAILAIVLAAAAWESLPEATRDAIPDKYKPLAVALGGVLVMAARLIQQKKPAGQSDNSDGQG